MTIVLKKTNISRCCDSPMPLGTESMSSGCLEGPSPEDSSSFEQASKAPKGKGLEVSTLIGILVPDQWVKDGEIAGFALCTDDEQKYVLNYGTEKDALMGMLRQTIEVSGIVTEGVREKTITVTDLHLLPSKEKL